MQLDQNILADNSMTAATQVGQLQEKMPFQALDYIQRSGFDGGFKIESVTLKGAALKHVINHTMMRVDLPTPLKSKQSVTFSVAWHYNINDQLKISERSGYEFFPKDGNYLYEIAQFYPRMAVYSDFHGWQNKQFLGNGEFALPFGDYRVSITAPADHVVGATGNAAKPQRRAQRRPAPASAAGRRRQKARAHRDAGRGRAGREGQAPRHQNLDLRRQERARLRLGQLAEVHLGCDGHHRKRQ